MKKYTPIAKKTAQQLVKVADEAFSKYVRLRDSDHIGDSWVGTCITCSKNGTVAWLDDGKLRFVSGWDAGHFIQRGAKITRFDEENVNLQCAFHCNKMKSGNLEKYKPALDIKYGEGTWRKLSETAQANQYYKFNKPQLLEIIHDAKEAIAFMEEK